MRRFPRFYCRSWRLSASGVRDAQTLAAACATALDDITASSGLHAGAESVGLGPLTAAGLVGPFHDSPSSIEVGDDIDGGAFRKKRWSCPPPPGRRPPSPPWATRPSTRT